MKLIFIASLSHSGSTLLDLILSCHPSITGMGEVHKLANPGLRAKLPESIGNLNCTCGRQVFECPVWSAYAINIQDDPTKNHAESYRALMKAFQNSLGAGQILSDSSKYLPHLKFMIEHRSDLGIRKQDLRVIHLVKDVRGYVYSQLRQAGRRRTGTFTSYLKWYIRNRELDRFITDAGINSFSVGYEELCMNTESVLKRICNFLDIDFDPRMMDLKNASGHLVVGNPMRKSRKKSSRILYDNRWFADTRVNLIYCLMPVLWPLNKMMVYGNTIKADQSGSASRQ